MHVRFFYMKVRVLESWGRQGSRVEAKLADDHRRGQQTNWTRALDGGVRGFRCPKFLRIR